MMEDTEKDISGRLFSLRKSTWAAPDLLTLIRLGADARAEPWETLDV
jgi:hypothetical protein